jgi:rubrerythrin
MPKATQQTSKMGGNRTGVQMSPMDIKKMLSGMDGPLGKPTSEGDETRMQELRASYIADADPVGSVPPPATAKGALKSGAKMLTGKRPQALLDKLAERLAFERTGARLYEALMAKCKANGGAVVSLERVRHFRDEEARHFKLVHECIETLGGDPTVQTPSADVAGVEAVGLVQVLTDPKTSLAQSLHAILVAELTDNAAWDELILLAREMGQSDMASQFEGAQKAEREHLQTVRQWHQELTLSEAKA